MSSAAVLVAGAELDCTRVGLPLEIVHGRSTYDTQPDAPTAAFTWMAAAPPAGLGDLLQVVDRIDTNTTGWADPVLMWDDTAAVWGGITEEVPRFTGTVDQLTASEQGGRVVSWAVGAVGGQARLGYRALSALFARGAETDVARVQAIAAYAGAPVTVRGTATVTVHGTKIIPIGEYGPEALSALHEVCVASGGLLWQDPAGQLTYGTGNHRAPSGGVHQFDCTVIADGLSWEQSTDQIVNQVTIGWGPDSAPGTSTFTATPSPGGRPWGLRSVSVDTILQAETDAEQLAQLILTRRSEPFWRTPELMVWCDELDNIGRRQVAYLDVSDTVVVPYPMTPGDTPGGPSLGILEGWVETWDETGHTMRLSVSDSARWSATRTRTWVEAMFEDWDYWKAGSWMDALIRDAGDPI